MKEWMDTADGRYAQTFSVPFEYSVYFTSDLFGKKNSLFGDVIGRFDEKRRHRVLVWVDQGVARAHPTLMQDIWDYFEEHDDLMELADSPTIVPGGEAAKAGWAHVRKVIQKIARCRMDRQSFVVAIGGGAVLDMVGFAAAIVHRGLRLIRVPTTTLSQNDAGIGVKNGINDEGQKNFIGTFAPPVAVLNDRRFLSTLSFEQWIGGVSEAFKVAIIKDADFFSYLRQSAAALKGRDETAMAFTVYRCAVLHLDHIRSNGDPFEFGSARPLDFGHWAAHKIEGLSDFRIGHGQAVAMGIALDAFIAGSYGYLTPGELDAITEGLVECGLPIWDPLMERRRPDGTLELLDGLARFQEHLGGRLTITLPEGIGRKKEVHHIAPESVEKGIRFLKGRSEEMFSDHRNAETMDG